MKRFPLFLVLLVVFIDWMGIGLVYPMFSAMLFTPESTLVSSDTSHATRGVYLGILLATLPLTAFFSGPLLGMFSDQKGRKKMLQFGLLFGVLGYFIAFLGVQMGSLFLLIASRVVVGVSAGTAAVVSAAIADVSKPESKAKNFGLFNMACGVGFTVGPFLGGVLSESNYYLPFLFAGFVTLLNLILIWLFFNETYKAKKSAEISWTVGLKNIRKAFRLPALNLLFLVAFLFAFAWSFYYEFIPVAWIAKYNFGTKEIGQLYALGAAVYALSTGWLIRPIVNRYKPGQILIWTLLVQGVFMLLFLFHFPHWLLWVYLPLQNFLVAPLFPTASALVSNAVDEHAQGEMLGILQSCQNAAFALSPLLAGPVLGISVMMPMVVGGGVMLLAGLLLIANQKTKRPA